MLQSTNLKWTSPSTLALRMIQTPGIRPDVSVAHIVGGTRGVDDVNRHLKRLISQYTARGGVKIVHRCGVLIGEFKRAPARAEADIIGIEVTDLLTSDDAEEVPNRGLVTSLPCAIGPFV